LRRLAALLATLGAPSKSPPEGTDLTRWWSEKIIFDPNVIDHVEAAIRRRGLKSFVLIGDQFEEIFPGRVLAAEPTLTCLSPSSPRRARGSAAVCLCW
jgi:hypothetical protein